jgi:hypothetical protein
VTGEARSGALDPDAGTGAGADTGDGVLDARASLVRVESLVKLGPVTRPALREAFRVIERAQRALALELGLRPR